MTALSKTTTFAVPFAASIKDALAQNVPHSKMVPGKQVFRIVSTSTPWQTDRFFVPITTAAASMPPNWPFKKLYKAVCLNLGATPEEAAKGIAPCPYNTGVRKDMRGLIRSWVEERSPHSRQRYFRAGSRSGFDAKPNLRPLLFVNPVLGEVNNSVHWAPYTPVRGGGWTYNPEAAEAAEKPSEEDLNAAAALYLKKGMQGQNRTVSKADVKITNALYTVTGSVFVCT
jgi:hypothetical protein